MKPSIVLTGATGNTGQILADELARRGVPFAAMARSEKNRSRLAAAGIHAVHGDFDDAPSMVRALEGASKAYLVCTPDHLLIPREVAFLRAAKKAGVRHVVKCSAYMAGTGSESQNLRSHGIVERELMESGMEYTILRPHGFMQTFTLMTWDLVEKAGVVTFPAGDGAMPLIDVRDVAAVAARALTEPGHTGKAYDLTGPEALTFHRIAQILGDVLGKPVTYVPGREGPFMVSMRLMGVTPTPREHVATIARMVRERRVERVHTTLQDLGIEPTTYERFVRDLVAGRTGGGNSFEPPNARVFKMISAVMPVMMKLAASSRRR